MTTRAPIYLTAEQLVRTVKLPFELKPKQIWALEQMADQSRGAFYTDVGTGKTVLSTLTAMQWQAQKVYITMPPILLDQWDVWLRSINEKDVSIYRGPKRAPELLNSKWVLMSHAIFRDSFDTIKEHYRFDEDMLIVEEAHAIQNSASKFYKKVRQLSAASKILLLSGTPTSNPGGAYAHIKLKTPDLYRSRAHFDTHYVEKTDIYGNVSKWKNLGLLAKNLALQAVKLSKEDIFGKSADPIYDTMTYSLEPAHLKLYTKLAEEQLLLLDDGSKIDATTAQRLYHALQQVIVNWDYFANDPTKRAAAYDLIDEVIEQTQCMDMANSKLSIWVNYTRSNASITKYLRAKFGHGAVAAAYGDVDAKVGIKSIMEDPKCRILVAHPKSAGVGLNMQYVSNEMLFIEASPSPLDMRQTIGRIDRAGQEKVPHIRFALAKGTVQNRLFKNLLLKDDLVSKVERTPRSLRDELLGKD